MTTRRVALLLAVIVLCGWSAWGQSISPSPPLPSSSGCTAPNSTTACTVVGANYSAQLGTNNIPPGSGSAGWSIVSGLLPAGLGIDAAGGVISGSPTTAGLYTFTVAATFSTTNLVVTQAYSIAVSQSKLTIVQPAGLPSGTVGFPINPSVILASGGVPFIDTGGNPTYHWSIAPGSQPDGLVIDANTGILSGTPTNAGSFNITVGVIDAVGSAAIHLYTFNVTGNNSLTITTTSLPGGVTGTAYSQILQQTGGPVPGVTWIIAPSSAGQLPPGLTISSNADSTGTISGTPTTAGTYNFTVQASYQASVAVIATQALSITITSTAITITTTTLPAVVVNTAYNQTIQTTGPTSGATWTTTSGSLPPGLNLGSSTGAITGTATTVGTFNFTVQVTAGAVSASQALSITVNSGLSLTSFGLPFTGFVNQPISGAGFTAAGGTAPFSYTLQSGTLPPGINGNSQTATLNLSGSGSQTGTFNFTLQVTDSSTPPQTATAPGTITIVAVPLTSVLITPTGTTTASSQPTLTLTIGATAPAAIRGTMTITNFTSVVGGDDPEIRFSNGLRTVTFTIASGATQAVFPTGTALMVGTVAGNGTMQASFQDAFGNNLPASSSSTNFSITATVPVIKGTPTIKLSGTTYTVTVTGFSSPLDMTSATFNFTSTTGTNLTGPSSTGTPGSTVSITVPVNSAFATWFGSSVSAGLGSQFTLTVPFTFTVSGGASSNPISAVTVTLTNSRGASTTSSPANP